MSFTITHNFDFYRTVKSRLGVIRQNCYIAQKNDFGQISMVEFKYQKDFFKNVILEGIKGRDEYTRKKMLIASIPFYRNLAEYSGEDEDYLKLTCFLHYKTAPIDTSASTMSDLWSVINQYCNGVAAIFDNSNFMSTVNTIATDIVILPDEVSLENKLILSIGARLYAEKYLKQKIIEHEGACPDSESNQTREWYDKAKPYLTNEEIVLMDEINLVTPESIHLNAFMYEPLIDISVWNLVAIFLKTADLGNATVREGDTNP